MTRIKIEAEDIVEGIESMQHIMVALQALQRIVPILTKEKTGGGGAGPVGPGPGPGGEWFHAVRWLLTVMEDSARHLRNQIEPSR